MYKILTKYSLLGDVRLDLFLYQCSTICQILRSIIVIVIFGLFNNMKLLSKTQNGCLMISFIGQSNSMTAA